VRKPSLPVYVAEGTGFHAALYSGLALLTARRDRRRGWHDGRPGPLNLVGIPLGLAGLGFLAGAAAGHHQAAPDDARATVRPEYLARTGAYGVSRNPLYVGGMAVWFGWATWRGSRRSAVSGLLWLTGLAVVGVPYEERMLEAEFGDTYRSYQQRVRRWL
jgi:protein-S-isoprenylcysteine O-methyltransferase Ste14